MALVSISEAARLANVTRPTLYKYRKAGKISFTQDGRGNSVIDTAELIRVFGSIAPATAAGTQSNHAAHDENTVENKALQREIELLRELIVEKDKRIEDLQQSVRLLADSAPKKRGFWWPFG